MCHFHNSAFLSKYGSSQIRLDFVLEFQKIRTSKVTTLHSRPLSWFPRLLGKERGICSRRWQNDSRDILGAVGGAQCHLPVSHGGPA